MNKKFHLVFLCTDNFGRSVISKYCLQDYLAKNNIQNFEVSSAGTNATSDTSKFSSAHFDEMKKMGLDVSDRTRTQIDENIVKNTDLIIGFDNSHKKFMKENFNLDIPIFNEIYKNESSELRCSSLSEDKDEKMILMTRYICGAIPQVFANIKEKYL